MAQRYRLVLDFTAADDQQAARLGEAWAGTCAAEYGTEFGGVVRLTASDAAGMNAAIELPDQPHYDWTGVIDDGMDTVAPRCVAGEAGGY